MSLCPNLACLFWAAYVFAFAIIIAWAVLW